MTTKLFWELVIVLMVGVPYLGIFVYLGYTVGKEIAVKTFVLSTAIVFAIAIYAAIITYALGKIGGA